MDTSSALSLAFTKNRNMIIILGIVLPAILHGAVVNLQITTAFLA